MDDSAMTGATNSLMRIGGTARVLWLGLAVLLGSVSARAWEVVSYAEREYVTAESMRVFYGFKTLKRSGNTVELDRPEILMQMAIGQQDCLINGVKFVLSNKVECVDGKVLLSRIDLVKLIDPVLRPTYIANAGAFQTVILDPGHGGKDPGATSTLGNEAAYNLTVARKIKGELEKRGFRVVMTRASDIYLTLQERVDLANQHKEAVFISIHFNSGGRTARGIETFTLSPMGVAHYGRGLKPSDFVANTGNVYDSANVALATAVHGSVLGRLGKANTFDRGIKRARYSVLTGVRHPSILLEGGFLSHPTESQLINGARYQDALALGVAEAIVKYRNAVSRPAGR
jgi:N-acetylmuramoyl-L-alanine amidase